MLKVYGTNQMLLQGLWHQPNVLARFILTPSMVPVAVRRPDEHSSGVGTILWGDDQTMGTVLVARMAAHFKNKAYAAETARQQVRLVICLTWGCIIPPGVAV